MNLKGLLLEVLSRRTVSVERAATCPGRVLRLDIRSGQFAK